MRMRPLRFAVIILPLAALGAFYFTHTRGESSLEVLGEVPSFELTERSGKRLSRDDLKGKAWIANFVFTHCSVQCPRVSAQMRRLQKRFETQDNIRLVTFTVDPERDSAKVLADYASKLNADSKRWYFLTGTRPQLESLIQKGFRLATPAPGESGGAMTHSLKLVLVDPFSRIRGYYDGMDEGAVSSLVADTTEVLRERYLP